MASKELHLVQSQRMENGSSSRMVFPDDAVPFPVTGGCVDHAGKPRPPCGFVVEGTKLFSNDKREVRFFPDQETAALRRSLNGSPSRMERDGGNARSRSWNIDDNDGSDGEDEDDDDEDDGVEDVELDEGDGEVDGLVNAGEGNIKNNNNSSGSVHSSSEKMRCKKTNAPEHNSCFGLSRMIRAIRGEIQVGSNRTVREGIIMIMQSLWWGLSCTAVRFYTRGMDRLHPRWFWADRMDMVSAAEGRFACLFIQDIL